ALSLAKERFQETGYNDIPGPESLSSITPEKRDEILAVINSVLSTRAELQSALGASLELQRLLLPTSLAEMQMIREYNKIDTLLFDVPITAIHGEIDDKVTASEIHGWQE